MSTIRRDLFPLVLVLAVATIVRFGLLGHLPLTGAEARLWRQTRHRDVAYIDGPAGNAIILRQGLALQGAAPTEATLRATHAALGVLCVVLAYGAGRAICTGPSGLLAAALMGVGTPFVMTARLMSVAVPQTALILLTTWLLHPVWTTARPPGVWRVLLAGIACALLFNFGYVAYVYLPMLLIAIAIGRPTRHQMGPMALFTIVALAGVAPIVLWNIRHNAAMIRHVGEFWPKGPAIMPRLAYLVNWTSAFPLLVCALGLICIGRRDSLPAVLPGCALFVTAVTWPAEPFGPLASGMELLLLPAADLLHGFSSAQLPRQREWFPLRFLVPVLSLVLFAYLGHDAIMQTFGAEPAGLYRAASEQTHRETAPWHAFPRVRTSPWRHHLPRFDPGPWFVLEDGLAAQMGYYMDVPVYGLCAQHRLWGLAAFETALIASTIFVDRDEVTYALQEDFGAVEGPTGRFLAGEGASPYVTIWRVSQPKIDIHTFGERYGSMRKAVLYQ